MITATKEFKWEMAHLLDGHVGLCKNLHGHSYRMEVEVRRRSSNVFINGTSEGMVIDFSDLKMLINSKLIDKLDHAVMLNEKSQDPFEQELISLCMKYDKKAFLVKYRPTAENMVKHFYLGINSLLIPAGLEVVSIRVYETKTSCAEYTDK